MTTTLFTSLLSSSSLAVSCLSGYLLLRHLLCDRETSKGLFFFLAPGLGFAISALILYFQLYLWGKLTLNFVLLCHVSLLALLWIKRKRPVRTQGLEALETLMRVRKRVFALALVVGTVLFLLVFLKSPYGVGIDAWAIWRLKARFLFHGSAFWTQLSLPPVSFSPVDYPLLYPLVITWGWLAAGQETHITSFWIGWLATLSIAGVLMSQVRSRGFWQMCLVASVVFSTPHLIGMGSSLYADILVTYFNVCAAVMLMRAFQSGHKCYALTGGFFLGASAFVKNEGMLFLVMIMAACLLSCLFLENRERAKRGLLILSAGLGMAPMLLCVATFKLRVTFLNAVFSWDNLQAMFTQVDALGRLQFVLGYMAQEMLRENAWGYIWVFFGLVFLLYFRHFFSPSNTWLTLAILFLNLGYLFVYMIPVADPTWKSWDRMLLQQFAVVVFLVVNQVFLPRLHPFSKDSNLTPSH